LQTFFISDSNAKQQDSPSTKPARACDACYDTVFPVIHPGGEVATNIDNESHKSDTITSLSHLPSWLSMPSLPVPRQPHELMAIDTTCSHDIIPFDNDIDDVGCDDPFYTPTRSIVSSSSPISSSRRKQPRREDTARRSKRFSMPAIGLQTTVVTARTSIESEEAAARLSELLA
jgi:FYVE/RhoGEF/PH domain-containing protein 5/6